MPDPLTATGLTLSYRENEVVHAADITLVPGGVTVLVGPNGSGKSTLLKSLVRLHVPDAGNVFLGEQDLLALPSRALARTITMLSQQRGTPSGVAVRELVEFGRHPHRGRWRQGDPEGGAVVHRAMEVTGVLDLADHQVAALSGGQAQRVWLASCLAQDTPVLLLDEPTTYLDLRYQVEILDLVRDLADLHGKTVGMVLHDLDQAAAVADQIVLLADGRVRAVGTPAEVLRADLLSEVYGIRVDVRTDPATGLLHTAAVGRHRTRHLNNAH